MGLTATLCARCQSRLPRPRMQGLWAADAVWDGVVCACCGAPLPPETLAARLIAKTIQLARFGLAQGTGPLLKTPPPPSRDG